MAYITYFSCQNTGYALDQKIPKFQATIRSTGN